MHHYFQRMFIAMGVLVLILSAGGIISGMVDEKPYLFASKEEMEDDQGTGNLVLQSILSLMTNLVLISHAIPMSIYVAIEVLKYFQVRLVLQDPDLFWK